MNIIWDDVMSSAPPSLEHPPESGMAAGLECRSIAAPGKVNLTLEILGKRPDGYHELSSLMVPINWYDTILARRTTDSNVSLTCSDPALSVGPDNLIIKAAHELQRATGCRSGAQIHLDKRLPMQAGLGGGSSDAAATLAVLNHLWNLHLSRRELLPIASVIGSDVPFFLMNGPAWCRGRGEIVEPIDLPLSLHLVLVKPRVGLGTAEVYRRLALKTHTPREGSGPTPLLHATKDTLDLGKLAEGMSNDLQDAAFGLQPQVAMIYERLSNSGARKVLLSGSGSTVFGLCDGQSHANRVAQDFRDGLPLELAVDHIVIVSTLCGRG
jgi:4-diphosphocytidyl-2-C-methyl-D-erythritol kinase